MELGEGRVGNFSFNTRRLFVAAGLVPFLLSIANFYLDLGLFGHFGKKAIAAAGVVLFLVLRYLGPTVEDTKRHRNARRGKHE